MREHRRHLGPSRGDPRRLGEQTLKSRSAAHAAGPNQAPTNSIRHSRSILARFLDGRRDIVAATEPERATMMDGCPDEVRREPVESELLGDPRRDVRVLPAIE